MIKSGIDYALWELTQACNLSCLHCRAAASPFVKEKNNIKDISSIKKVINELASVNCPVLALTGGEPLLHKDIVRIVDYATSKGLRVRIQSNGLLLTKNLLLELKKAGIYSIGIGLDGSKPEIHDLIRNKKGALDGAIKAIKLIKRNKIKVHVEFTVTNLNIEDLKSTLDLLESLKVDTFLARSVLFSGRAKKTDKIFKLTPKRYETFLKELHKERKKRKFLVYCQDPLFNNLDPEFRGKMCKYGNIENGEVLTGCTAGLNMVHIRKNGDIGVCTFLPGITLGNILDDSLKNIWENRAKNKTLNKIINRDFSGKCKNCSNKYICGGCRARALTLSNSVLGPDPYCLNPLQ